MAAFGANFIDDPDEALNAKLRMGSLSLTGVGEAAAAWAPANLGASLYAFWDAEVADLLTIVSDAASQWVDATANAYALTQATSTARPAYSATSFNGRPGLTFDKANNQRLVRSGMGSLPLDADPCEIWALASQSLDIADTAIGVLIDFGSTSNAYRRVERVVVATNNRAGVRVGTGAAATPVSNTSVDFTAPLVVRARIGATATQVDVDGVAGSSSALVPATAAGNINVGRSNGGSLPFSGVINAIAITAPLSGSDETAMLAWAAARVA